MYIFYPTIDRCFLLNLQETSLKLQSFYEKLLTNFFFQRAILYLNANMQLKIQIEFFLTIKHLKT